MSPPRCAPRSAPDGLSGDGGRGGCRISPATPARRTGTLRARAGSDVASRRSRRPARPAPLRRPPRRAIGCARSAPTSAPHAGRARPVGRARRIGRLRPGKGLEEERAAPTQLSSVCPTRLGGVLSGLNVATVAAAMSTPAASTAILSPHALPARARGDGGAGWRLSPGRWSTTTGSTRRSTAAAPPRCSRRPTCRCAGGWRSRCSSRTTPPIRPYVSGSSTRPRPRRPSTPTRTSSRSTSGARPAARCTSSPSSSPGSASPS